MKKLQKYTSSVSFDSTVSKRIKGCGQDGKTTRVTISLKSPNVLRLTNIIEEISRLNNKLINFYMMPNSKQRYLYKVNQKYRNFQKDFLLKRNFNDDSGDNRSDNKSIFFKKWFKYRFLILKKTQLLSFVLISYRFTSNQLESFMKSFLFSFCTKHVIESINLRTVDFMQTFQKFFFKQVIQLNCFLFFFPNVMKFSSFLSNSMILLFLAILRLLDNLLHFWSERTTTSYNVILIQKKFE